MTHKQEILNDIYFQAKHTTEILISLHGKGVSIGAKSLCNRLQDLQTEGKIVGLEDKPHREKLWKRIKEDMSGQRTMI